LPRLRRHRRADDRGRDPRSIPQPATTHTAAERPTDDTTTTDTTTIDAPRPPTADLDEVAASADLARVYLNEIGKVALLTAADEVELAKRIEAGL